MKTMTIIKGDTAFRWRGGSFIAVWAISRMAEHVPDDMIELPASLNRTQATRADIERIVTDYDGKIFDN